MFSALNSHDNSVYYVLVVVDDNPICQAFHLAFYSIPSVIKPSLEILQPEQKNSLWYK